VLKRIKNLKDVVDWGLCTGCGACYSACSRGGVELVNVEDVGIRPRFRSSDCASCTKCLSICPGYQVDSDLAMGPRAHETEADHEFGPALELWEGYASDPEIRYQASSGGLLSALSLYCIERLEMKAVLHSAMDQAEPWKNTTSHSTSRSEILARAGSRYAPASPGEGLRTIEESDRPWVFIGKPCDVAAACMLRQERPALDRNLGLVLTFFCAGTPSSKGTLDLLKSLDIEPADVSTLRYRGEGWPGKFKVISGPESNENSLTYEESWGALTSYRPLRCNLCPDGLGRVADIACGDAWNHRDATDGKGRSILVVRTPRGREILQGAIAANYVEVKPLHASEVLVAQSNLLQRRRELFGRLLAMRLLAIPTPQFAGFSLFRSWIKLPVTTQFRSVAGTLRRLLQRGLWRRQRLFE
jgi:coenzyme F420 hydrogenase subunit beta